MLMVLTSFMVFLSTPSARRATCCAQSVRTSATIFLSTPSARRATKATQLYDHFSNISIHALREEGDAIPGTGRRIFLNFYPRPPRGGRRFVPTDNDSIIHFYPRPPRGGRPVDTLLFFYLLEDFYPRPPRGGRPAFWCRLRPALEFLSTPSARRATHRQRAGRRLGSISIHALREEGDSKNRDKISIFL